MEILAINPTRKKKKKSGAAGKKKNTKKVGGHKTMARKKRKAPVKRRRRRNPSRARRAAGAVGRRAKKTMMGMNIGGAIKNVIPMTGGSLAAQWAAKRFGDNGGANDPDWEAKNYMFGALGAFAAGALAENIKSGMGQKVLEGGLNLLAYKLFVNELAPQWEWADEQFGADDIHPDYLLGAGDEEYNAVMGAGEEYAPGDAYVDAAGNTFVLGSDELWYPANESHRMLGETSAPPSDLGADPYSYDMGETSAPPSDLGYAAGSSEDPYARAYHY